MSILMYKQRFRPPNYKKTPKCNYAHIRYIATRRGASKNEGMRHGLFGKLTPGNLYEFENWQSIHYRNDDILMVKWTLIWYNLRNWTKIT